MGWFLKVGLSSFGAYIFTRVKIFLRFEVCYNESSLWIRKLLKLWNLKLLKRIHVPALTLEKLLKIAQKPHSEIHLLFVPLQYKWPENIASSRLAAPRSPRMDFHGPSRSSRTPEIQNNLKALIWVSRSIRFSPPFFSGLFHLTIAQKCIYPLHLPDIFL